jgi:hypothetical protein
MLGESTRQGLKGGCVIYRRCKHVCGLRQTLVVVIRFAGDNNWQSNIGLFRIGGKYVNDRCLKPQRSFLATKIQPSVPFLRSFIPLLGPSNS